MDNAGKPNSIFLVGVPLEGMSFVAPFATWPVWHVSTCNQQVGLKLGVDQEKIQLRRVSGEDGEQVPRRLQRDEGLLVDVMDNAQDFNNKVIHAVVVA